MRILLLAHAPSVHTQRWARAFRSAGHDVRLFSVTPAPDTGFPAEAIGWRSAPIPFLRYAAARGAVRRALAEWRPDVTVAHFVPNYGFLAAWAGASPLAVVAWGSDLLVNARQSPLHRARARWVLRRADLIHVDAPNLARAAAGLGAPADRVWTRPWGVDAASLAPASPWRRRVEEAGRLRILWTRMIEPVYDPVSFVAALGRLHAGNVTFQATIAGEGSLRGALESEVARLGLGDAVGFAGFVDEERLRGLYREHEVYVSMSRSDSTSQSLLEAMAAGLAVVASDIPGNKDWLRDAAVTVPCGDDAALAAALAGLWNDPATEARVERAMARVRGKADWKETVAQCEERLRALVAGRREPEGRRS